MRYLAALFAITISCAANAAWTRPAMEKEAERAANHYKVPPALLKSICRHESNWIPGAVGAVGEIGVCQLRPETVLLMYGRTWRPDLNQTDRLALIRQQLFDPKLNLWLAARYVAWMLRESDGDIALAVVGYNAGPGVIRYVRRVQASAESGQ